MPGTRKAYLYWGAGVVAYLVAVFHRQTLGVTGLEAAARFDLGAAGSVRARDAPTARVRALYQVPVGILVDRVGSKKMLIAGSDRAGARATWSSPSRATRAGRSRPGS